MRTFALAVSLGLIFALTLGVFLATQLTTATIEAELKFEPSRVDLGAPAPKQFEATLRLSRKHKDYNVSYIDAKTILVEGVLSPKGGWKHVWVEKNTLKFELVGPALVDMVIWSKIYHMGIVDPNPNRPYKIPITVTGQFYDDTFFEGTGYIRVLIPSNNPPPPPPQG